MNTLVYSLQYRIDLSRLHSHSKKHRASETNRKKKKRKTYTLVSIIDITSVFFSLSFVICKYAYYVHNTVSYVLSSKMKNSDMKISHIQFVHKNPTFSTHSQLRYAIIPENIEPASLHPLRNPLARLFSSYIFSTTYRVGRSAYIITGNLYALICTSYHLSNGANYNTSN